MSHTRRGSHAVAALVLAVACMLMWVAPAIATETAASPATSSTAISTETKTVPGTTTRASASEGSVDAKAALILSLIHISESTRLL